MVRVMDEIFATLYSAGGGHPDDVVSLSPRHALAFLFLVLFLYRRHLIFKIHAPLHIMFLHILHTVGNLDALEGSAAETQIGFIVSAQYS